MKTTRILRASALLLALFVFGAALSGSAQALQIATSTLPDGMEIVPYSATLQATNGAPPYAWSAMPWVVGWGRNLEGQTTTPPDLTDVTAIAAGRDHSLALRGDGTVVAWGWNAYGQTATPADLTDVTAIAAGWAHSLALRGDGTVVGWGNNLDWGNIWTGQATPPSDLANVTALAAGGWHSLALRRDGTVVAWGNNEFGQTTLPAALTNAATADVKAIVGGALHSLALRNDGTVVAWGHDGSGQATPPPSLENVTAIAAGAHHSLALRSDGTVVAWGAGWAATPPPELTNAATAKVTAIVAGAHHSLALQNDGTVVAWGNDGSGEATTPDGLTGATALAAGDSHSLALRAPQTALPDGLILSLDGVISGTPTQAGTNPVTFVVQDSLGAVASRTLDIVIAANPNTRPVIHSTLPPTGAFSMNEGTSQMFQMAANDPENMPLTYSWTWNGAPVGENEPSYTHAAAWGDAGQHILRGYVSDGLWNNVVFAQWTVAVVDLPMEITTSSLAPGQEMAPYSATLQATNGAPPYTWSTMPSLVGWGANWQGQATPPPDLTDVTAIAAGGQHSLALKSDGTVVAWGDSGQTPQGGPVVMSPSAMTPPPGLANVTAIAAGWQHNLALRSDGTVVGWGSDWSGQATPPPELTNAATANVTAIAAGGQHSLALRSDGTVVAWGADWSGQATPPPGLTNAATANVTAIAAGGQHSLALRSDGTIIVWGDAGDGQATPPIGLTNVTALAAGGWHTLALRSDGTVIAWGSDWAGQATPPPGLTNAATANVTAIAAGGSHSLALQSDGTVVAWGENWSGQTTPPPELTNAAIANVTAIAAGDSHSLALRAPKTRLPDGLILSLDGVISGTPTQAGTNRVTFVVQDNLGAVASRTLDIVIAANPNTRPVIHSTLPPTGAFSMNEGTSQMFQMAANDPESMPLTYFWTWNGAPVGENEPSYIHTAAWGDAGLYILRCYVSDDLWTNVVFAQWTVAVVDLPMEITTSSLAPGQEMAAYSATLQATNGAPPYTWSAMPCLVGWGDNGDGQATPPIGLTNVTALAAGGWHTLALRSDGTVIAWGNSDFGQAMPPPGLANVTAIAAGEQHSLALQSDGTVVGWGLNDQSRATPPPGLSNVTAIAAGGQHSLALRSDGTVVAWGDNWASQATPPPGLANVTAIAAGEWHSLALRSDGTVVAWGANMDWAGHQATPPPGLADVTAIAVGGWHNLALLSDGTVVAWGANWFGQATPPPGLANVTAIAAGEWHSLALRSDGTVVAWGDNGVGQATPPPGLVNVTLLDAGNSYSLALRAPKTRLPDGLILSTRGLLSGAPTQAGTHHVTFVAQDSLGAIAARTLDIVIAHQEDADSVPAWWWTQYGFDPTDPPDANTLADASGMTFLEKFRAGLVPGDPNSRLEVDGLTITGDPATGATLAFAFETVTGRRYVIQSRENLTAGEWTNLSDEIPGTGKRTVFHATMPAGAAQRFYRLIVLFP